MMRTLEQELEYAVQKYGMDSPSAKMLREQLRVSKEAPASLEETYLTGAIHRAERTDE
jgi:hypothetical protein